MSFTISFFVVLLSKVFFLFLFNRYSLTHEYKISFCIRAFVSVVGQPDVYEFVKHEQANFYT